MAKEYSNVNINKPKITVYQCPKCGNFLPSLQAPHPPCDSSNIAKELFEAFDIYTQAQYQQDNNSVIFVLAD